MDETPSLLQQLLEVGDAMSAALETGNVERFSSLLAERGTLLERLQASEHPQVFDADWEAHRRALIAQHEELEEAMQAAMGRLTQALNQMKQHEDAAREYNPRRSSGQLLNPNLRG